MEVCILKFRNEVDSIFLPIGFGAAGGGLVGAAAHAGVGALDAAGRFWSSQTEYREWI